MQQPSLPSGDFLGTWSRNGDLARLGSDLQTDMLTSVKLPSSRAQRPQTALPVRKEERKGRFSPSPALGLKLEPLWCGDAYSAAQLGHGVGVGRSTHLCHPDPSELPAEEGPLPYGCESGNVHPPAPPGRLLFLSGVDS